jgi:hypothetical protein
MGPCGTNSPLPGAADHQGFRAERRSAAVPDRKRVRPDPDRPVEVQVIGPDDLDVLYARDISECGLGVFMPHAFDASRLRSEVELIVRLPDAPSFQAGGVLRHRTVNGPLAFFGVELIRVPESARQNLRTYIQGRLAMETHSGPAAPSARIS